MHLVRSRHHCQSGVVEWLAISTPHEACQYDNVKVSVFLALTSAHDNHVSKTFQADPALVVRGHLTFGTKLKI